MFSIGEILAIGADIIGLLVCGYMITSAYKEPDRDVWLFTFVMLAVGLGIDLYLAVTP